MTLAFDDSSKLPRITIVTPSFNQGKFLRETIESILSQNYNNLEYFVIDGGSQDESVKVIQKYEAYIDWWVTEKDKGQSDAINKGFKKATGELLCWVNSDDVLLPGCLHSIAYYYQKYNHPDLIHSNCVYINQDSQVIKLLKVPRQTKFFMYRGVWSAPQPSVFYKSSLVKKVDYLNPEYHLSMDIDIWMKMIQAGAKIAYVPRYLGGFRWHNASKSSISLKSKNYIYEENHETEYIFNTALKNSTKDSRKVWRKIWQLYQLINLNYLRSYLDTVNVKGQHWKQAFHEP